MNEPDHEQDCEKYSKSPVLGSKMHYDPVVLVQKHGWKKKTNRSLQSSYNLHSKSFMQRLSLDEHHFNVHSLPKIGSVRSIKQVYTI